MAPITFIRPVMGDLLTQNVDYLLKDGRFFTTVFLDAQNARLEVNGVPAHRNEEGFYCALIPLDGLRCRICAKDPDTGEEACIIVWRLADSHKVYRFTVDDCIRCFEDLHHNRHRYESIFDNPYLAVFYQAYQQYGSLVHLNLFYENADGSFDLSMMTDRYIEEFKQNAHWLSMTFHSKREFPGAPYQYASYEEVYQDCRECTRQIARFAGRAVLRDTTTLHFGACSAQGTRALRAFGFRGLCGYLTFTPQGEPLVSYHLSPKEIAYAQTREGWYDAQEDVVFTKLDFVLNDPEFSADRIEGYLDALSKRPNEGNLIQMVIHEQYFYSDYPLYEPDYAQRILTMARWMDQNGYKSISFSQMLKEPGGLC